MSSGRRRPAPDAILSHAAYPALDSTHGAANRCAARLDRPHRRGQCRLACGQAAPGDSRPAVRAGHLVGPGRVPALARAAGRHDARPGHRTGGRRVRAAAQHGDRVGGALRGRSCRRVGTRPDEPAAAARSRGHGVPARHCPRPWPDAAPGCARPADQDAGLLGGIHAHRHRASPAARADGHRGVRLALVVVAHRRPVGDHRPVGALAGATRPHLRAGLDLRRAMARAARAHRHYRGTMVGSVDLRALRGAVARRHRVPPLAVRRVRLGWDSAAVCSPRSWRR